MKQTLVALLLGVTCCAQAQLVSTSVEHPTSKVLFPAAITKMQEGSKYYCEYPEQLTYNPRTDLIFSKSIYLRTDAKKTGKKVEADYIFRIVTPGISDIQEQQPEYLGEGKGYTLPLTYRFPLKAEVYNKAGELLKTIVVSGDSDLLTEPCHAGFLNPKEAFVEYNPVAGFNRPGDAKNYVFDNMGKIQPRLEKIAWYRLMIQLEAALECGYGEYKMFNAFIMIYNIDKKYQAEYAEVVAAVAKQREAIDKMGDKGGPQASLDTMKSVLAFYNQYLSTHTGVDRNVRKLILYNGALCALFNSNTTQAKEMYDAYLKLDFDKAYYMRENFTRYYNIYQLVDKLKYAQDPVIYINTIKNI